MDLVLDNLGRVRSRAREMARRIKSPTIDVDDLTQAGTLGLMKAAESFDPRRGVKFETYCQQRITWAMLDYVRTQDWVGQRRNRMKLTEPAPVMGSLGDGLPADAESYRDIDTEDELDSMLRGLPTDQRLVMKMLAHDMTPTEIAGAIGVSQSRISQIRKVAGAELRTTFAHLVR